MAFHLQHLGPAELDRLARHYDERGYALLEGVPHDVVALFEEVVARRIGLAEGERAAFFSAEGHAGLLPRETRERLARVPTDPALAARLLEVVGPVLARVMGPLIQVSREFHCQVKGAPEVEVDYGGFEDEYVAVQGTYLPHQDFTGATLPTSPCFAVLWVGVNECPDWTMRFWPGTQRMGLLCDRWFPKDHPLLDELEGAFDVASRPGTAILFNSLVLHGGTRPSTLRRVSCDLRFFPLCGFLDSQVHAVVPHPLADLRARLAREDLELVREALVEDALLLGQPVDLPEPPPLSIGNWARYLALRLAGQREAARPWLERFANTDVGVTPPEAYVGKYHDQALRPEPLASVRRLLEELEPADPGLSELERALARAATRA